MIYKFKGKKPNIHEKAFVAQSADLIGNVILEEDSNVWFGAVLRADVNSIYIGKGSNIQDNSVVHVDDEKKTNVEIGNYVTVGHGVILHGCKIDDYSLIGMGTTILNGAEIGSFTIIGANSLVTSNKKIPSGVLCMGSPAKVIRKLTEKEIEHIKKASREYIKLSKELE